MPARSAKIGDAAAASPRGAGVTIRYGIHPTPFGKCLIGTTERGICHLGFVQTSEGDAVDNLVREGVDRDLIALEIRRVAREHGVPVFEAPPLARAIYALAPLDREIPSTLFVAVAQVLAYVWQVRTAGAEGWRVRRPDLRFDWEDTGR